MLAMERSSKIVSQQELVCRLNEGRPGKGRIVLCHGHFNVIHPGHLRFLNFARAQGEYLVVSIESEEILAANSSVYYSQEERASGVAGLEVVDAVCLLDTEVARFIRQIKPDVYVKGKEFEDKQEAIQDEIDAVSGGGGRVIFSSGEAEYASPVIVARSGRQVEEQKVSQFLAQCRKRGVQLDKLKDALPRFKEKKFLVVGDTIVDQFVACDVLGVSSEAPVMTVRELEAREFLGGAGIVACHLKSLGARTNYVSVVGDDANSVFVESVLDSFGVRHFCVRDSTRPTSFKIRYMVDNQKLLRVSRLEHRQISRRQEDAIIDNVRGSCADVDGIVISDFVYGVVTPRLIERLKSFALEQGSKIFADSQCSSQMGDVSKFKDVALITPTEREARAALGDESSGLEVLARKLIEETRNENIIITLGSKGVLAYKRGEAGASGPSEYFCALSANPIDVAGAGDAFLSGSAMSLCSGLNIFEATVLGSLLSAICVERIGNIPVEYEELEGYLSKLARSVID